MELQIFYFPAWENSTWGLYHGPSLAISTASSMLNKQGTHKISAVFPEIKGYKTSYCFILKRYFKRVWPPWSYIVEQQGRLFHHCRHTLLTRLIAVRTLTSLNVILQLPATTAVRFLMRKFRNVFFVCVGKRYVRLWRLQRSQTVDWGG